MYNVGNSDKRLEAWSAWHDTVGPRQRDMYVEFVKLANKSAYLGGEYKEAPTNAVQVVV